MKTKHIILLLYVLSWIIFVGLSIVAGGFVTNTFFAWFKPDVVPRLWQQADLSAVFEYDRMYFLQLHLLISVVTILKAVLFYFIIIILPDKNFSLSSPFNKTIERFILKMSFVSFLIGLFSTWGSSYAEGLMRLGLKMPDLQQMYFDGAGVWWLMAVVLFVIGQIFKRGMALQAENDLTV
ncbi:MAG TPA: hypothetical protein PK191_06060 [Niabella sp.]|nr:hypothetical protein [Niabella sp.]HOZ96275.1 hypothetical protein [Niabella sp.]HQW14651.1 hypothetical protein [Niabella sp.]HQX19790.1 hypothetical protein [Niabella sp.]HQX41110.1 hypothetical protein [Niabella sp.]